jgi:hypothetical protein
MKQRNLLLMSAMLIGMSAMAQKTVFTYQTEFVKSAKRSPVESIIVPDETSGKTTVILVGNDNAEYLLLDKSFEIESKVHPSDGLLNTIFHKGYSKYLTGVKNNKGSCFFYAMDRTHINMEIVDFKNNTVFNSQVIEMPNEEHSIEGFTCQGRYYLLSANDKKNELVIYLIDENGILNHRNIPIDLSGFNPDKLSLFEYFSYSNSFYPKQETELIEATDMTKFYPYTDKVQIIVTNDKEPPHIWSIDLKTYNVSKKKFDLSGFTGFNGKKEKFYNNSYLYGENLYVLNASKKKIEVGIFNFNSNQLIQKYEITEASSIPFVEPPVRILTNSTSRKQNIIENNKELINKMFKGSIGIAVAQNNKGQIILTCGEYYKVTGSTSEFSSGFSRGSFQQSSMPTGQMYSGSNVPVMRTFSDFHSTGNNKGGGTYNFTRTVKFEIMIDSAEYKLVSSDSKLSTVDKINNYLKLMPAEIEAIKIFTVNNNYYLSYYSPKKKAFLIKEMER